MHIHRTFQKCGRALWLAVLAVCVLTPPLSRQTRAQCPEPYKATLAIHSDRPGAVINLNIYGQFSEHLGRLIYDGVWVGEGSPIPKTRGMRSDIVAALKEMHVPALRWPGGCFADEYHWRDGIGPRDKRPRRPNASWSGLDTNAFSSHEFMDLSEMIGADQRERGEQSFQCIKTRRVNSC